jgi:hypothetical protein
MRWVTRGLYLILASAFVTGCIGSAELVIPPTTWQTFYQAEYYKTRSVAAVKYLGVVGVLLTTVDVGLGRPAQNPQAVSCADQQYAAYCTLRDGYNNARQTYDEAQASWNAWISTLALLVASNRNVQDWPDYKSATQAAVTATTAFFNAFPPNDTRLARANVDQLRSLIIARGFVNTDVTAQANELYAFGANPPTAGGAANPMDFITPLLNIATTIQAEQDKLNTDARTRLVSGLNKLMWDNYDCVLDQKGCRAPQPVPPTPQSGSGG